MKRFDLGGKIAIVTGGNGGIGLGMARGLAECGAAVMVAGRDRAKNPAAVEELAGLGVEAAAVEVDLTREVDCEAMVAATRDRFGGLHIPDRQCRHYSSHAARGGHRIPRDPVQRLAVPTGGLSRDEGSRQRHDRHDAAHGNAMLGIAEVGPQRRVIDEAWEEWITK